MSNTPTFQPRGRSLGVEGSGSSSRPKASPPTRQLRALWVTYILRVSRRTHNHNPARPEPNLSPRGVHGGIHQPPRNAPRIEEGKSPRRRWQPRDQLSNTPALQAGRRSATLEGPGSSSRPKASPPQLAAASRPVEQHPSPSTPRPRPRESKGRAVPTSLRRHRC